jgi:hypothetical protein
VLAHFDPIPVPAWRQPSLGASSVFGGLRTRRAVTSKPTAAITATPINAAA